MLQQQQQSQFSYQLRKYLKMSITIWPSLRPGLKNLTDIPPFQQSTLLPQRSYHTMTEEGFLTIIINDIHAFVMEHDVKEEDLQDYLEEILDLLSITEEVTATNSQVGGVRYMAREFCKVIQELQNGKIETVEKFEKNIYNVVMEMGIGEVLEQGGEEDEEVDEEDLDENDGQMQQENWEDEQIHVEDIQKTQEEKHREKQLQDDGWVIVKKK